MTLKFRLDAGAVVPEKATPGSQGYDICASHDQFIPRGTYKLVKTGVRAEFPIGYELQVRPRSGLALKHGITVLNTPGTIDTILNSTSNT